MKVAFRILVSVGGRFGECRRLIAADLPRPQPVAEPAPVGKYPIGKSPIGKYPVAPAPAHVVTKG